MKDFTLFNKIITLEQTDSTNSYIRRQAAACDALIRGGLVVNARSQTEGRGRKDRCWHSGRNMGLTFSFLLDISEKAADEISMMTLAAGVAVAKAMDEFGLDCKVKWPNDIYIRGKKLCGILTETIEINGSLYAICGIGINVNFENNMLEGIGCPATSIYAETACRHNNDEVLDTVLASLDKWLLIWLAGTTEDIIGEWNKAAYGLGKGITVLGNEDTPEQGFFVGLGKKGQLLMRRFDSSIKEVWSADLVWQ